MKSGESNIRKVCVIGLGYIGLPTGALLASRGYDVHGVDVVQSVVDTINKGNIHIVEPDLDEFVRAAVMSKKLVASTVPAESDVFIIAVPTPFHDGFVPNVDYIEAAAKSIAPFIKPGNIVILESTSPVGATVSLEETLREEGVDVSKIYVAHCPERVLPGKIMKELTENARIVGGTTEAATKVVSDFYREFVTGEVLETDATTAEMAKLTENSFRDVNIAFANELSILCDKFGINAWDVIKLANHHPRVNILNPGVGVGGHCIAVDPWFIVHKGGEDAKIIRTAREVNLAKTEWVIEQISAAANEFEKNNNRPARIACLGLAFKPNIDDLRESPALEVTKKLVEKDYDVAVVEPNIKSYPGFKVIGLEEALTDFDVIAVLVAHDEFQDIKHKGLINFCGA